MSSSRLFESCPQKSMSGFNMFLALTSPTIPGLYILSLLFVYLSYSISRSPCSFYLHLATFLYTYFSCVPTDTLATEKAFFVFVPHSFRCAFDT